MYHKATSEKDFYTRIKDKGLTLYFRGKQAGVIGKRKYRLRTLGYSLERIQALNLTHNKRQQELNRIVAHRNQKDIEREL